MLNQRIATKIIKEYIDECKKRNIFFQKVILFGSIVSGRIHEYSDIDLALVSDQFNDDRYEDRHLLSPINIHYTDIEPHTYSTKYFEEGDPFIEEIKKTGIEIDLKKL
jgi:predicted nucleotidyltransferase